MSTDPIVIVASVRTPMGSLNGAFKDYSAVDLGATTIKALIQTTAIDTANVDAVMMGCVLPAGLGQAPARQAALLAGLPKAVHCVTLNKVCGSAMQSMIFAHDGLVAGTYDVVIAGGMENMSRAPYMLTEARNGYRLGHGQMLDHLFTDGLEDAYEHKLMGVYAEQTAGHYHFSREAQDAFALSSLQRAQDAVEQGIFKSEIAPVTVTSRRETLVIDTDETPQKAKPEKIPQLKPAFAKDGTVTAANASSIADGAAAVMLMRQSSATKLGLKPLATIRAHAAHSHEPEWFTTAPVGAIKQVLKRAGWSVDEVDLFEINEAFAVVTMAAMHDLKIPQDKVNVHGGACALGHPLGASGARIVVTLLNALQQQNKKRGVASLCIGGGEATAIAVELGE